jgi:hypothetical protein
MKSSREIKQIQNKTIKIHSIDPACCGDGVKRFCDFSLADFSF